MMRRFLPFFLFFLLVPLLAQGRSALSPRHSGMEPPDAPKRGENMAGRPLSRTPSGGMGYTDAYGNPVEDGGPEENRKERRPKPEWMEKSGKSAARLPDSGLSSSPLWKFQ